MSCDQRLCRSKKEKASLVLTLADWEKVTKTGCRLAPFSGPTGLAKAVESKKALGGKGTLMVNNRAPDQKMNDAMSEKKERKNC